jgi:hypothetical protein
MFLDADDYLQENAVAILIRFLDDNPSIHALSGVHSRVGTDGSLLRPGTYEDKFLRPLDFLDGPPVSLPGTLLRSSFDLPSFEPALAGEDWIYMAKLVTHPGFNWKKISVHTYNYRATPQARSKASIYWSNKMLMAYDRVRYYLSLAEPIPRELLKLSEERQIVKLTARLIASGKPLLGQHLLSKNFLNCTSVLMSDKKLKQQVAFWCDHLDSPAKQLYHKMYIDMLARDSSKIILP